MPDDRRDLRLPSISGLRQSLTSNAHCAYTGECGESQLRERVCPRHTEELSSTLRAGVSVLPSLGCDMRSWHYYAISARWLYNSQGVNARHRCSMSRDVPPELRVCKGLTI